MESKLCTKCKVDKPLEDFYRHRKGKFGRNPSCKECSYKNRKQHWVKNRDKYVLSSKKHRDKCTKGVYFIKATNGTYVGQSNTIELRIANHKSSKNKLTPVEKIISWKILEEVENKKLRLKREDYWINKLNPTLNYLHIENFS